MIDRRVVFFFWGGLLATSKPLINDDQNEKNEKQENL